MGNLKDRLEALYRAQGVIDDEIDAVFKLTEEWFADNRYDLVDEFLLNVDACRLGPLSLEGILRSTFRFQGVLSHWEHFLGEARGLLASMGHDPETLLAGLVPISELKPQTA